MRLFKIIVFLFVFLFLVETPFGRDVPSFWIRNLEGKRFDSRQQDQPYVLSFFFVHCVPCIKEIPALYKLMKSEFPETPLLFIDPVKEDSKKDILKFSKKLKVPRSYFYRDNFGSVSKKFFVGKFLFPTIIGIRDGNYLFKYNGLDEDTLDEIRELL
tara:strand:- start:31 stop:501 length:471 start_codon:yes stop_codon:yes gene_type:complete